MKVLGIVTARGGSKGIPGKNLKLLAGKPLLAYTIEAARASAALDRIILSTEDQAIADAGRALWCDVPFLRPADLARDDTPHLPVIQHAVKWMDERAGYRPDQAAGNRDLRSARHGRRTRHRPRTTRTARSCGRRRPSTPRH